MCVKCKLFVILLSSNNNVYIVIVVGLLGLGGGTFTPSPLHPWSSISPAGVLKVVWIRTPKLGPGGVRGGSGPLIEARCWTPCRGTPPLPGGVEGWYAPPLPLLGRGWGQLSWTLNLGHWVGTHCYIKFWQPLYQDGSYWTALIFPGLRGGGGGGHEGCRRGRRGQKGWGWGGDKQILGL